MSAAGVEGEGLRSRVPLTYERAATSMVRSRFFVNRALEEARMALEILSQLDQPDAGERWDRHTKIRSILQFLERLSATDPPRWGKRSTPQGAEDSQGGADLKPRR